jgi:hypothetical protein
MSAFTIDAAEIAAFGDRAIAAARRAPQEYGRAGKEAGMAVQRYAQAFIPVDVGTAKANTTMESVTVTASSVEVIVSSRAVSAAGFPYPIVLEEGRGPITAKPGKVLVFPGKDGKTVFTKRVGPYAGTKFMSRALDTARPFIEARVDAATQRLIDGLVGG